jgi:hypothetical protein
MQTKTFLAALVAFVFGIAVSRADESGNQIAMARSVVALPPADVYACFIRRDGTWRISGLGITATTLTDSDFEKLASVTSLIDLGLDANAPTPADAFRHLVGMPQLRRFATHRYLTKHDLQRISMIPLLTELVLSTYSGEGLADEGLAELTHVRRLGETKGVGSLCY